MLTVLGFALAWLLHLRSITGTVPADNIEQLVWAGSLELGYWSPWVPEQLVRHGPVLVVGAVPLDGWRVLGGGSTTEGLLWSVLAAVDRSSPCPVALSAIRDSTLAPTVE